MTRRPDGTALPAIVVAVLALLALACRATATGGDPGAIEVRLAESRAAGDYAAAATAAGDLLDALRDDPGVMPFELRDIERERDMLALVGDLPEPDRRRFARADSLTGVFRNHWREGRFDDGLAAAEERLAILRELLGESHVEVAAALNTVARFHQLRGDYDPAERVYREALEMRRGLLTADHPDVATSLNNLGMLMQERCEYDRAEPLLHEALEIYRAAWGDEDVDVASCLNNIGMLLHRRGDLAAAEPLYLEALAIRRAIHGEAHADVATSLNNLASLHYAQGDYTAAEPLLREATSVLRRILGPEHPRVATGLNNLAALHAATGNDVEAEPLIREALAINRAALGNDHPEIARSLANLAHVVESRGDYTGAEMLLRDALAIRVGAFGGEHELVAETRNAIAHVLQTYGAYAAAEREYRAALELRERLLGRTHLDVATSLSNLASLLELRGEYDRALPLYERALGIRRELLGDGNAAVAHSMSSIGHLHLFLEDYPRAADVLERAAESHDAARLRAGTGISRATAAQRMRDPFVALAVARLELGEEEAAWRAAEQAQGRALADLLTTAGERKLSESERAREDSLRTTLADLERELEAYVEASATDTTAELHRTLDGTRNRLLAAEAEWSAFGRTMREKYPVTEGGALTLSEVTSGLTDAAAIVGWVNLEAGAGVVRSWGYVLKGDGSVSWARLDDAPSPGAWRRRAARLRKDLSSGVDAPRIGILRDARAFWQHRFAPLMPLLDGIEELIVVPSGPMLGVPAEALADDTWSLLGSTFAVSYAPSATIAAWLRARGMPSSPTQSPSALLLGDPPFVAYPALPASRDEVAGIAEVVGEATVLLGEEASEQRIAALAETGGLAEFDVLHLATHALVDDERPDRSALVLAQTGLPDRLESVLGGQRVYDGLATAGEIVREWDLDAELVSLSACETGLGREVTGEGYVGFAHAFLQAGARSLLVSLWKVDDLATSMLVGRFYENWIGAFDGTRAGREAGTLSKVEALQEAKAWLRDYEGVWGTRPFEHPYFWSSFILIGDPR